MSISFSDIKSLSCNNADILKVEDSSNLIIWSETFDIIYDPNSGKMPTTPYESSYRYGIGFSEFPIPTRSNYLFNGWYSDGKQITAILSSDKGTKNLVAKWSYNPPIPTYSWRNTGIWYNYRNTSYENALIAAGYTFAGEYLSTNQLPTVTKKSFAVIWRGTSDMTAHYYLADAD